MTMEGAANWAPLGDQEFTSLRAIYEWCEDGRTVASNSGLILVQAAYDLRAALMSIPTVDRHPARKANRVVRHVTRSAEHLHAVQVGFARVPKLILQVYAEEIGQARRPGGRRPLNLKES